MDAEDPPANLSGVIARSRSRYKGNRPNQVVTSTQTPPKVRPEQLYDHGPHASGPNHGHEPWRYNAKSGVSNARDIQPAVSRGVAEDEYNFSSVPSTRKYSTGSSRALSDRGPQETAVEAPTQDQTKKHEIQRTQVFRSSKAGHEANEDETKQQRIEQRGGGLKEYVVTRKLSSEFTAPQEHHGKLPYEHLRLKGGEIGERNGRSGTQPVLSPPMPLERFQLREQVPARPAQAGNYPAPSKTSTLQKRSLTHKQKGSTVREELKRTISAPMPVEPAEISIKPAFDAPVSAVNAGERRVRVHFNESVLSIPVMPSTTPLDIIREASTQLSISIDAKANVLLESFKQLGLERSLRRYEHVRDVMNSWDNDSQNTLNIVPSPTGGTDDNLDLKSVLQSQPGDTSVHIYHSNAPGAWDKRWITLRSDGQVVMMKRDGKETSNICHVSDFDIYIPTKRQMAKKIKPPKKYCFAVKSQQKSAMFLTTENFVHFFAAGDRELAMVWYKAVQEWRSWYLVNVMGEGQKDTATSGRLQKPPNDHQSPANHQKSSPSFDHESQQIGAPTQAQLISHPSPINCLHVHSHGPPPISFPKKLTKDATGAVATTRNNSHHRPSIIQHQPLVQAEQGPFAAQSLLGRTYTQRHNAVARESREKAKDYGFPGHHIGNDRGNRGDGLQRRSSQRPKQKPLLDLTPKYQEPPQHRKRGHGFLPEHIPAGGLVEAAMNIEPIVNDPLQAVGADLQRSRTGRSQHPIVRQASASPEKPRLAFTGSSLLSQQKQDPIGDGVKTEDRTARKPLLDATTGGPWAKGSLLDRVNSGDSALSHVIDRAKRHEVDSPVGEGL